MNFGALVTATPQVQAMVQAAARAGLIPEGQGEQLLDQCASEAEASYLACMDAAERE